MAASVAPPSSTILPFLARINDSSKQHCKPIRFILASQSPGRLQVMKIMGIQTVEVIKSDFEENSKVQEFQDVYQYVVKTAIGKLNEVYANITGKPLPGDSVFYNEAPINVSTKLANNEAQLRSSNEQQQTSCFVNTTIDTPFIIVAADTVVEHRGCILEKPKTRDDALQMISKLSGEKHSVHTGVAIASCNTNKQLRTKAFSATTEITLQLLTRADIEAYVDTAEGYSKAGGYGIQGLGANLVSSLNGSYFNAIGLPLELLSNEISAILSEYYDASTEECSTKNTSNGQ